ncbi:flagellar protein FlaG [Thiomicrospira microaerophila]|uniref:flagellar protein FlaG n=1 Tax=Thiomicrospira microaerophila TaxID=406020 RepID=UPI00200ED66C|nr:flagellar protein FlaG [Thiomicrospira microaerophila]UQB42718.1 flagellar protein FlaG [Thiomicrospira microaerophila]
MDMVSVSSLASTTSIRPQLKSSLEEGLSPHFSEDFSRLASRDIASEKTREFSPVNQSLPSSEVDSFNDFLDQVNKLLQQRGASLFFEIDDEMKRPVLFIKDAETKEIIRQVPSDSFLDMSRKITDYLERSAATSMANQSASAIGLLTTAVV